MIEALLLATTRVLTFDGARALTAGTGFFFRRDGRLYLVSSRHVFIDTASAHQPDRVQITVHLDHADLTRVATLDLPLYADGRSLWVQGEDSGGAVDVAVLRIPDAQLPAGAVLTALEPSHIERRFEAVHAGDPLVLVGFPLGFYDTVHQLPVVRQATVASAYGVRFQGQGCFITDARVHRGASGAPVLRRHDDGSGLPWTLLGIHSSRFDMNSRDRELDESLGLNCAWYADILDTLTAAPPPARPAAGATPSGTADPAPTPARRPPVAQQAAGPAAPRPPRR